MRMFLVVMCDIFLMLYLTAVLNTSPKTVLTIEDFFQLKSKNETLESDKQKAEAHLQAKLKKASEEQERLLAEKKRQQEAAAARLKDMEESLALSDSEKERIQKDLLVNEELLKNREQLLEDLNRQITEKEELQLKLEAELESQALAAEESRKLAEQLRIEAENAARRAQQMEEEADLAYSKAETADTVRQQALDAKERALKEKEEARLKADKAMTALKEAEAKQQKTLEELEAEKKDKKTVLKFAKRLANTIEDIKQDGAEAYQNNMRPRLQTVNLVFERKAGNRMLDYRRTLSLLPFELDGKIYVMFPSRQAGFSGKSDRPPDNIKVWYNGDLIKKGWINLDIDLIALSLPGFDGEADKPYPPDTEVDKLMPALLAVRNNGNIAMSDKVLGVADDYFLVNRDLLEPAENSDLKFTAKGWRGTRNYAERIVLGDQLVDLNGRLVGIANEPDRVVRVETINGWSEIKF